MRLLHAILVIGPGGLLSMWTWVEAIRMERRGRRRLASAMTLGSMLIFGASMALTYFIETSVYSTS